MPSSSFLSPGPSHIDHTPSAPASPREYSSASSDYVPTRTSFDLKAISDRSSTHLLDPHHIPRSQSQKKHRRSKSGVDDLLALSETARAAAREEAKGSGNAQPHDLPPISSQSKSKLPKSSLAAFEKEIAKREKEREREKEKEAHKKEKEREKAEKHTKKK